MAVSKRLRYEVLRRDNHACRYCGASAPDVKLNVDHVIPTSLGGSDKPTNLVTACADCNSGKTSSLPNATPVSDVEQEAFRKAVENRVRPSHDPETGMPTSWSLREIELALAEFAWSHAWTIATDGHEPCIEHYEAFLKDRGILEADERSGPEIICAAVAAGLARTSHLSWGLDIAQLRHAPINLDQFARLDGALDTWLSVWEERHEAGPTLEQVNEFKGRVVQAARDGRTREQVLSAARSAAFAGNSQVDYFAYHIAAIAADDESEKVGEA